MSSAVATPQLGQGRPQRIAGGGVPAGGDATGRCATRVWSTATCVRSAAISVSSAARVAVGAGALGGAAAAHQRDGIRSSIATAMPPSSMRRRSIVAPFARRGPLLVPAGIRPAEREGECRRGRRSPPLWAAAGTDDCTLRAHLAGDEHDQEEGKVEERGFHDRVAWHSQWARPTRGSPYQSPLPAASPATVLGYARIVARAVTRAIPGV